MPASFKIYGYSDRETSDIQTLDQASLAFIDAEEMLRFAEFVLACAREASKDPNWDHDHYFNSEGGVDIVLSILDPLNY